MSSQKNQIHLSDQVLAAMLDADKPAQEMQTQMTHLDACKRCQSRIQMVAAGSWWWTEGLSELESGRKRMDELEFESRVIGSVSDTEPPEDIERILQDSSHPEMLGRLDEYEIETLIGVGGMGVVFKGFDRELNRAVAIKALLPRLASFGPARKRFGREAQAAAAIVHPNVVSIHRIQPIGSVPYIVMPYVAGDSLQSRVEKEGNLDGLEVVRIAMQIAGGLSAAHEQGLVHRDIKPANILLENGCNRVLITDFGLARAADDASLTRTGLIAGTPHYMSPEQAKGETVDSRSDLFSLGCVLYFLVAGRPPFRAEHAMGVLNKICVSPARDIRELCPRIPMQLAFAIHRLLEKSPELRFPSAQSVHEFMKSLLAHLQNPIANHSPAIKAPKSLRGTFQVPWVAACVAFLLIASIAYGVTWWTNPPSEPKQQSLQEDQIEHRTQDADRVASLDDEEFFDFGAGVELTAEWSEEAARINTEIERLRDEELLAIDTSIIIPGENR